MVMSHEFSLKVGYCKAFIATKQHIFILTVTFVKVAKAALINFPVATVIRLIYVHFNLHCLTTGHVFFN